MKRPRKWGTKHREEENTSHHICAWDTCEEIAHYPAPITRDLPDSMQFSSGAAVCGSSDRPEMQWFCMDHIREFNASWNFFDGMSEEEIIDFQKDALVGHRKTKPIVQDENSFAEKLEGMEVDEILDRFVFPSTSRDALNDADSSTVFRAIYSRLSTEEKRALDVLGAEWPLTAENLKRKYKELVKKHHPDLHLGEKAAEEKFKAINAAYHYLKINGFFERLPA